MRIGHWTIVLLIAGSLCGCTWVKERWPWRKKEVPVTPPAETSGDSMPPPAAPPHEIAPDSRRREAPETAPDRTPPQEPAPPAAETPPVRIEQPVMLENLAPDTERIAPVDTIVPPAPEPKPPERRPLVLPAAPATQPSAEATLPKPKPRPPKPKPKAKPPKPPRPDDLRPPQELPPAQTIVYGKEEVVAAPLIRVDDRFITVDDVLSGARDKLAELPATMGLPLFRSKVVSILREEIQRQVIQSLVLAEAKQRLTEDQEKAIEAELQKTLRSMIAEVGGSRKKLEAILVRGGTDLETVLDDYRRRMTVEGFLRNRFYPAISVTRQMLWRYYLKNKSRFTTDKQVRMQIIAAPYDKFLPEGGSSPSADERRAAEARAKEVIDQAVSAIKSGEEFGEVARRLSRGIKASQGGVWPMMPAGSFREAKVEQAAFAMKTGQVSEVIRTPRGYYIVKVKKVRAGQTVSFEKAQEQIEKDIRDEQFQKLHQEYVKGLLAGAQIVQPDEFLELAADRAVRTYRRR